MLLVRLHHPSIIELLTECNDKRKYGITKNEFTKI